MRKFYIGFGHKARQGKDTAAKAIHCADPENTKVIALADSLKAYCRVQHGMTKKDAPLLQRVGLAMRGERHADIWIDALQAAAVDADETVILVPDVRFANEAAFIKDSGGILIKMIRYNPDHTEFRSDDRPADHPSETALDDYGGWDYVCRAYSATEMRRRATSIYSMVRRELRLDGA